MKDKRILNNLNKIASKESLKWIEEAELRIASRDWIEKSSRIAMRIRNEIKDSKKPYILSQRNLARKMGVSPQYINKILKGHENLSLETISKIEKVLDISLIEIPSFNSIQEIQISFNYELFGVQKLQAKKIFTNKPEMITPDNYNPKDILDIRA
jgi:Helix-turn-helix.